MAIDCIVCGTCCVDVKLWPFPLADAIGHDQTHLLESIDATTGGIVANAGIAMSRLGLNVAALSLVGEDQWANIIYGEFRRNGIDTSRLFARPTATSITTVMIDDSGERSFGHLAGAMNLIDAKLILGNLDMFAQSQFALVGYYALVHEFDQESPRLMRAIRETGCRTAMDTAGGGGDLSPLDHILPELDYYIPSLVEGRKQTGKDDPDAMIDVYRNCGAPGVLGIKLGADGVLLSPNPGELLKIDAIAPPGPIVDTTGAGDSFYAGLIAGLVRSCSIEDAAKIGAAAGACCVTSMTPAESIPDFETTAKLAGVTSC